jgi:hypothetical protein
MAIFFYDKNFSHEKCSINNSIHIEQHVLYQKLIFSLELL